MRFTDSSSTTITAIPSDILESLLAHHLKASAALFPAPRNATDWRVMARRFLPLLQDIVDLGIRLQFGVAGMLLDRFNVINLDVLDVIGTLDDIVAHVKGNEEEYTIEDEPNKPWANEGQLAKAYSVLTDDINSLLSHISNIDINSDSISGLTGTMNELDEEMRHIKGWIIVFTGMVGTDA
jgi:hypothetical protein